MEKALFKEKVDAMIPDLVEGIRRECDRLYECGGIDPPSYENNYILPKIIFTVALETQARQYSPPDNYQKNILNLRHF